MALFKIVRNSPLFKLKGRYLATLAFAALFLGLTGKLRGGEYYNARGAKIVDTLRRDFPIPVDGMSRHNPVRGVYWQPYTYWDWSSLHPEHSSEIVIYGVGGKAVQDAILQRIATLKDKQVLVTFYGESKFTAHYDQKGNGGASRLPSVRLRQELLQ